MISAPGRVTLVDPHSRWPHGTADVAERFETGLDAAAIARTPALLTIGSQDSGTDELAAQHDASQDGFGTTRPERLAENLRALGATPAVHVTPDGTHSDPGKSLWPRSSLASCSGKKIDARNQPDRAVPHRTASGGALPGP